MVSLRNTFNFARGYVNGDVDLSRQPALEYEQLAQVSGVAASYIFPGKKSAQAYDHWASCFCSFREPNGKAVQKQLQKTWAELVSLNPPLAIVEPEDKPDFLRNGIFGAASLFNPGDIRFFYRDAEKNKLCSGWSACPSDPGI